ncbi:MAG: hypothetical protein ACK5LL_11470, partial [Suipraeoptans sp.]
TNHIEIAAIGQTPTVAETYPVYTNPIGVSGADANIYLSGSTYYVRADEITPFYLNFRANINGAAQLKYQINHMRFELSSTSGTSLYDIYAQSANTLSSTNKEYTSSDTEKTTKSPEYLLDGANTKFVRTNGMKDVELTQGFLLGSTYHGKTITVTPNAGAIDYVTDTTGNSIVWADSTLNQNNKITIIPDAYAPTITGFNKLQEFTSIDADEFESFSFDVVATDNDSGLKEFSITILNQDNWKTKTYTGTITSGKTSSIHIDILENDSLFRGNVAFTMTAIDNVGNTYVAEEGINEFTLNAELTSKFYEGGTYRQGETAFLTIRTSGYANKLVVEFPSSFRRDNFSTIREFSYSSIFSSSINEEELVRLGIRTELLEFMIPIDIPEGTYKIKITAYKDGSLVEVNSPTDATQTKTLETELNLIISGSILDDFRTVILLPN